MRPDLKIGFFLHIPFPPVELFVQLPWRAEIVDGLLGADLIGFPPARRCRELPLPRQPAWRLQCPTTVGRRAVQIGYSVDPARPRRHSSAPSHLHRLPGEIDAAAKSKAIRKRAWRSRKELGNPKTILPGADRLTTPKVSTSASKHSRNCSRRTGSTRPRPYWCSWLHAQPRTRRLVCGDALRDRAARRPSSTAHTRRWADRSSNTSTGRCRDELVSFFVAADVMLVTRCATG